MNTELVEVLEKAINRKLKPDEEIIVAWLSRSEYTVAETLIAMLKEAQQQQEGA